MGHRVPAEAVPALPLVQVLVRALLIPFAALAGYFVAWGLVFCMDAVVRAFFGTVSGTLGWIPFAGKVISSPVLAIEHKLSSFLGGLEQHFERQMAARWHALASLVSQLAADTKAAAIFDYQLAHKLATLWGNAATGGLLQRAHHAAKQAQASSAAAERAAGEAKKQAAAAAASTAGATVVPHPRTVAPARSYPAGRLGARVAGLEGELDHVLEWDIPGLRARTRAIEHGLARLYERAKTKPLAIPRSVAIAAVAIALGQLGGSWIRCQNWNRLGRAGCRLPLGLIEALLEDAIGALVVADVCQIAGLVERAAVEFEPVLDELVNLESFICLAGGASYPTGIVAADLAGGGGLASGIVAADLAA